MLVISDQFKTARLGGFLFRCYSLRYLLTLLVIPAQAGIGTRQCGVLCHEKIIIACGAVDPDLRRDDEEKTGWRRKNGMTTNYIKCNLFLLRCACKNRPIAGCSPSPRLRGTLKNIKPALFVRVNYFSWWPWSDLNRYSLQNLILSQARLPIPPQGQNPTIGSQLFCGLFGFNFFNQTRTAVRLVRRFFCWFFNCASFLGNSFLDCRHFWC